MNNKMLHLDQLINLEKFQTIQDDIANATDMAVIAVDYMGQPITKHSRCSAFCEHVRKDPVLGKYCEKCDSRGGLEAARSHSEYIYLCHVGIVDIALPIIVEGQYLGALMAGQVLLENEENQQQLERIVSKKYQIDLLGHPDLKVLYDLLPIMSLTKIKAVTHMMQHLMNYVVGEAVLKLSLYDINEKLAAYSKDHPEFDDEVQEIQLYYPPTSKTQPVISAEDNPLTQVEQLKSSLSITSYKTSIIDGTDKHSNSVPKSVLLKPAIDYINENYDQKIYMDKMAYICNISTSYFSKIFKRETGESFSNYINKVKTAKAIELLESTTAPIVNISIDLGYDDCGYFIKVFKKNYGITPATYRKNFKQNH